MTLSRRRQHAQAAAVRHDRREGVARLRRLARRHQTASREKNGSSAPLPHPDVDDESHATTVRRAAPGAVPTPGRSDPTSSTSRTRHTTITSAPATSICLLWSWTTDPAINGFAQSWSTAAIGPAVKTCNATRTRRSTRCSIPRMPLSIRRKQTHTHGSVPDDLERRPRDLALRRRFDQRRASARERRPDASRRVVGRHRDWSIDPAKRIDRDRDRPRLALIRIP